MNQGNQPDLIYKYAGLDPLFTPDRYRDFAADLPERMTNPFLVDMIEHVTRDNERKLDWNDRLVGTMHMAFEHRGLYSSATPWAPRLRLPGSIRPPWKARGWPEVSWRLYGEKFSLARPSRTGW
ncbi:MAG: hypothetical protein ABSA01_11270 [Anaerolineales bacterium]